MRCIIWHTTDIGEGTDLTEDTEGEGGNVPRKTSSSTITESDNARYQATAGSFGSRDIGDMGDVASTLIEGVGNTVESVHRTLTDLYEDNLSEEARQILDPIIDSIPIIGDGRDMMDEYVERKEYLEKTGLSYDDVYDKQNFNAGISSNISQVGRSLRAFASRGKGDIQDVYSQ